MVRVFQSGDRTFDSNGDVVIRPFKARVTNEDNGDFVLKLECGINYFDYVKDNNILVSSTPQGDQAFRIRNVSYNNRKIEATAYHVYYDSENYLIVDNYVQNMTADGALDYLNTHTTPTSDFETFSDVSGTNNYRCVRSSLKEAVELILERWGGHLVRNNWSIKVMNSIGVDNGITIEYHKNIKEITVEYDWSEVVTKILPVGDNEIMLTSPFITSDTQYAIPYCKTVSFSQEGIEQEDYETEADYIAAVRSLLEQQARAYLSEHSFPQVSYTLKADPEKVTDIGDYILVKDHEIGVDLITQVTGYEYDAITDRFVSVEFGNYRPSVKTALKNYLKSIR